MPKKIRELKQYLSKAGFVLQKGRGKGSHSYWIHPDLLSMPLVIPGKDGDDAPRYLERQVNKALQMIDTIEEEQNHDNDDES